jgi:hypothetical protein
MSTITLSRAAAVEALLRRGWDLSSQRHGTDAVCGDCGWAENYLSTTALVEGCDAHDRTGHGRR